jgi:hypothetical protein
MDARSAHDESCGRDDSVSRFARKEEGDLLAWCAACDRMWTEEPDPSPAERIMTKGLRRAGP